MFGPILGPPLVEMAQSVNVLISAQGGMQQSGALEPAVVVRSSTDQLRIKCDRLGISACQEGRWAEDPGASPASAT